MIVPLVANGIDPAVVPVDALNAVMRQIRNDLLAASDWAMTSDASTDKQAWAAYRQQLRDFPKTWVAGPTADFPDPPEVI